LAFGLFEQETVEEENKKVEEKPFDNGGGSWTATSQALLSSPFLGLLGIRKKEKG